MVDELSTLTWRPVFEVFAASAKRSGQPVATSGFWQTCAALEHDGELRDPRMDPWLSAAVARVDDVGLCMILNGFSGFVQAACAMRETRCTVDAGAVGAAISIAELVICQLKSRWGSVNG